MIQTIKRVIGQPEAKAALNEIIEARNFAEKNKRKFSFPTLLFSGLTGTGKTFLAETFAKLLQHAGFQFLELPVKTGWREFDKIAEKSCVIDSESGAATAIPTVFFLDEAHQNSPIEEIVKLITGSKESKLFERNGTKFFHDPSEHIWILASNEEIDPAQKRRCIEIPFGQYNHAEKKALINLMCEKIIEKDALEYLESRTKPMAGDIDNLCKRLNLQPVDKIDMRLARTMVQRMGLFPQGLIKKDLLLMERMSHDKRPTPIEALKAKIGDVKTSATRGRLGWLQALELAEARKGGYALTNSGVTYLKKLEQLQKESKRLT